MSIVLRGISKSFGDISVLNDIHLDIKSGELIALLGPSGSGKTTLLRIIAGMDTPDAGTVILDGEEALSQTAAKRRVGFVFQHYALFRHMNVFENVAFGLRMRPKGTRPDEYDIRRKVMKLLALVHLDTYHSRYPSQLSGGQRQRVALARALAVEPKLLLLDEPFGALDAKVRKELRLWMRRLHDEIHITSIFVTHDQEEAMEVADRVVVMSQGHIEQIGTPGEVYHNPVNSFVYDFLGNYNVFDGWRDAQGAIHLMEYETPADEPPLPLQPPDWAKHYPQVARMLKRFLPSLAHEAGAAPLLKKPVKPEHHDTRVKVFARPHEMFIATSADDAHEYVKARVIHINPAGPLVKIEMERRNGQVLTGEISKEVSDMLALKKNDEIFVRPRNTRVFEDS